MKTATLNELKKELLTLQPMQVVDLCMHIVKYKKENKELLSYLLFEAQDEQAFINNVKVLIDEQFEEMNKSSLYLAKKTIRKVLRTANKYIRYSGAKQTQIELLIYFCTKFKKSGISIQSSIALNNLYQRQIVKINKALESLHEDLQFDYQEEVKRL